MTRKKSKGTPLKVFSGREATLNRVILKILGKKSPLIAYDVWLQLRGMKGFRNIGAKSVYRRIESLEQQSWIAKKGTRITLPGWDSELYEITIKGEVALILDNKNIEDFLRTANTDQLKKIKDVFL